MDSMINHIGHIRCYGHNVKDIDAYDKFAVVTYDEVDANPKRVFYDSISWVSDDWDKD